MKIEKIPHRMNSLNIIGRFYSGYKTRNFRKQITGCKILIKFHIRFIIKYLNYKLPRIACSLSKASKSALKFTLPKLFAPLRWMISKKRVGRSSTGLLKIWSR
mgnify:CR=1 FL=1